MNLEKYRTLIVWHDPATELPGAHAAVWINRTTFGRLEAAVQDARTGPEWDNRIVSIILVPRADTRGMRPREMAKWAHDRADEFVWSGELGAPGFTYQRKPCDGCGERVPVRDKVAVMQDGTRIDSRYCYECAELAQRGFVPEIAYLA